jgi:hypothetical protein
MTFMAEMTIKKTSKKLGLDHNQIAIAGQGFDSSSRQRCGFSFSACR